MSTMSIQVKHPSYKNKINDMIDSLNKDSNKESLVNKIMQEQDSKGNPTEINVKEAVKEGSNVIKNEGGIKKSMKNLGQDILMALGTLFKGLLQLLAGVATTAGSMLMGRGMGMGGFGLLGGMFNSNPNYGYNRYPDYEYNRYPNYGYNNYDNQGMFENNGYSNNTFSHNRNLNKYSNDLGGTLLLMIGELLDGLKAKSSITDRDIYKNAMYPSYVDKQGNRGEYDLLGAINKKLNEITNSPSAYNMINTNKNLPLFEEYGKSLYGNDFTNNVFSRSNSINFTK